MAIGTVFDHNNSQAVSIPAEVSLSEGAIKLRYASPGGELVIVPLRNSWLDFSSVAHASVKIFCPGERPCINQRGLKGRHMKNRSERPGSGVYAAQKPEGVACDALRIGRGPKRFECGPRTATLRP